MNYKTIRGLISKHINRCNTTLRYCSIRRNLVSHLIFTTNSTNSKVSKELEKGTDYLDVITCSVQRKDCVNKELCLI